MPFSTFPSPLSAFTFTTGGAAGAAEAEAVVAATGAVAWLNLLPAPSDAEYPRAALEARGVATRAVAVAAPHGLSLEVAQRVLAAFKELPPGPLVVQCASGNRASAVLALVVGAEKGWEPAAALEWAAQEKLPFLGTQPLRNWVVFALRALRGAAGAAPQGGAAAAPAPATPAPAPFRSGSLILRQLFHRDSSTYTYLLGDPASGEAALIDPVIECAERDLTAARELGLRIVLALNTHVHADHVSGASRLRGFLPDLRSAVGSASGALADVCLAHGQVVAFGSRHLRALATPGHTAGCMSYVCVPPPPPSQVDAVALLPPSLVSLSLHTQPLHPPAARRLDDESAVFTGDALLIRGCGRTDFQGGSAAQLYASVHGALFALPRATVVFPGHDYNGHSSSTIGEEADLNPRLGAGRSCGEFEGIMAALALARPALIDVAVPANLRDGILAGFPPAPGVVPPGTCIPCRQDGDSGEPPAPVEW